MEPEKNNVPKQQLNEALQKIKQKMKLLNFNNLQPPYFVHTLTKMRQTFLSPFLRDINIESKNTQELRKQLNTVHYIIQNFDDECFDSYASELIEPYTRKMFQDNYEFDAVNFKQANQQYHLKAEIQETLSAAAEWLTQIEITQDLLCRIQLYFKLKVPHVVGAIRQEGLANEKNTWYGSLVSLIKRVTSFSLRKGSKVIQSTFFTTVAPTALMLTFAIMGGTATLPWKTDLDPKNLIPAVAVIAVPYVLDTLASGVERSDIAQTLKRWAILFGNMTENITKFNEVLQEAVRNCTISSSSTQFQKQRTSNQQIMPIDLQKIILDLNKGVDSAMQFDEEKFEEMRERTQAYFKEYAEIQEGDWTLIISKQQLDKHIQNQKCIKKQQQQKQKGGVELDDQTNKQANTPGKQEELKQSDEYQKL